MDKIIFRSATGKTLTCSGTTVQNIQATMCNFESATGNTNDAIYYSNTNASSRLFLTDCVVTTYTSTTAKAINVVANSAGSIILANTTVQLVDNPDHVAIYLGGSISYTHTMDQIIGQVVTANTAHFTVSLLTIATATVPAIVHNSSSSTVSVSSSVVITTTATPAVTGVGLTAYFAIGYASTGHGGSATLNGGLGALPFDMASIKFRQSNLIPSTTILAGYANGLMEATTDGLYYTYGNARYKLTMTEV